MHIDAFQIAETEQSIEYYSYVREVMQTKEVKYWMGNPSVKIINGSIYLKPIPTIDKEAKVQTYEEYLKQCRKNIIEYVQDQQNLSQILLLVGIPNNKNPVQVCQKLNAYLDWIVQIKVIKTDHSRYYGMLLLFKNKQKSQFFIKQLFAEEYNGLQIERIMIRQVVEVSYFLTQTSKNHDSQLFQHRKKSAVGNDEDLQKIPAQNIFMKSKNQNQSIFEIFAGSPKKRQNLLPPKPNTINSLQQNSCAICQQQTKSTIISILCTHYFHIKCLSQWKQNICPLCRYHQHPPLIKFCEKCNQFEGLWVCLVCGVRLCCGLQHNILGNDSHIYQHYKETQHKLSMDVQTKFIFDASQPAFLHQMFYREVMQQEKEMMETEGSKKNKMSKLSETISEYEQSISEEMQKQRTYFEQSISKLGKQRKQIIKYNKKYFSEIQQEIEKLDEEQVQADQKISKMQLENTKLQKQLKASAIVIKHWKNISQTKLKQQKVKEKSYDQQLNLIENKIAQKMEELKDLRKNIQLKLKINSLKGKQEIQNFALIDFKGGNANKKKKK